LFACSGGSIALGYEDVDDHGDLRRDTLLATLVGFHGYYGLPLRI